MAEPALHEQLKQHFARRVTRQAISVIKLYRQCVEKAWKEQTLSSQLLDESEKLTQLARRFEMQDIEDAGYQIISLLKLSGGDPSASQTVIKGMDKAAQILIEHQKTTAKKPVKRVEKSVTIALNNAELASQLQAEFEEQGFNATCAKADTSHEQLIANRFLLIDIDFPSTDKGFQLANGLNKDDQDSHHLMFLNFNNDTTERRLKAIRANGQAFIQNPKSARQIMDEVFDIHTQHQSDTHRILIVDDSPSQAKFTENILIKHGLSCHTISDPMDLCSALDKYRPDLILMDMYMPNCDGIELACVIRQHHDFKTTPIIFLSAEEEEQIQEKALELPESQFMTKPPKASALLDAITQAITNKK